MRVGNAPVSWGIFEIAELTGDLPFERVMDEIAEAGYEGTELGPWGYYPTNPDRLRVNPTAVEFVRAFVNLQKPIAAICHAPWTLIEAGGVKGRRVTSWPSLKTDLINAGAEWVDEQVVVDGDLVTSRNPDDLPAFNAKLLEVFAGARRSASV